MAIALPPKDSDDIEPYFIIWCAANGTNTGGTADDGELQGATISTFTWTVPDGITKDSENKSAVTVKGVAYSASTVCTIWLSGGTDGTDYTLTCKITTSDSRTLSQSIVVRVSDK